MQKLRNRDLVPPDPIYFRYVHAETGHSSQSQTYDSWLADTYAHRRANNLPIPIDFTAQMEDQLCSSLPAGWCSGTDPNRPDVDMRFTVGDVWNWTKAQLAVLSTGFVSQDEAERRAKICSGCYMNINAQGCRGCQDVATLFSNQLAKKQTSADMFLRNCGSCRCYLRALVHFPIDAIPKDDTLQKVFPSFCWQKIAGENYVP